ncbi:MAG: DUF1634 domain-containing protein [Thermoanaerobaculia bacterium]
MSRIPAVSWVLRIGVLTSAAFLIAGLIDGIVAPDPVTWISPATLIPDLRDLRHLKTGSLVHAGLMILLLTPISRVVVLIFQFARERDRAFFLMSVGVLFLLTLSTWLSLR